MALMIKLTKTCSSCENRFALNRRQSFSPVHLHRALHPEFNRGLSLGLEVTAFDSPGIPSLAARSLIRAKGAVNVSPVRIPS